MTSEKFQILVLEKLESLGKDVANIKKDVANIKKDGANIKKDVADIKKDVADIKKEQRFMWEDIKKIDNRLEKQEVKIKKVAP